MQKLRLRQLSNLSLEILAAILLIVAVLSQQRILPQGLYLGFVLGFFVFFLLGLLAINWIWPKNDWTPFQKLPIGFGLSLGIGVVPTFLAFSLRWSIDTFFWIYLGLILVNLGLSTWQKLRVGLQNRHGYLSSYRTLLRSVRRNLLLVMWGGGCLVGFGVVFARKFSLTEYLHGDNWFFLSFIQRFVHQPHLSPTDPITGSESPIFHYSYNVYLTFEALLSRISGVEVVDLLQFVLPIIFVVTTLLTFLLLGKLLIRKWSILLLTSVLWLSYLTVLQSRQFFTRLSEPKYVIYFILIPLVFYFIIQILKDQKLVFFVILGGVLLGLANMHAASIPYVFIVILVLVGLNLILNWKKRERNLRVIKGFIVTGLVLAVLVTPVFVFQNRMFFEGEGVQRRVFKTSNLVRSHYLNQFEIKGFKTYILDLGYLTRYPLSIEAPRSSQFLKVVVLVLALTFLFKIKKRVRYQYLLVMAFLPPLVVFNPFLAPLLGKIVPPLLFHRFLWFMPEVFVLGVLIERVWFSLLSRPKPSDRALALLRGCVFAAVTAAFLYSVLVVLPRSLNLLDRSARIAIKNAPENTLFRMSNPDSDTKGIIDYLNLNSDYDQVVLMPIRPESRMVVPHISNYVVAGRLPDITGYLVGDLHKGNERHWDIELFYSPQVSQAQQKAILEKYHPTWVLSRQELALSGTLKLKEHVGRYYLYYNYGLD